MNTLQKSLIALTAGSLLSVGAQAAIYGGAGAGAGEPYVGVKVGKLDVGLEKGTADKATAYGVYGGYNFDPNFGAEVEFIGAQEAEFNDTDFKGNVTSKTYGAYGTYRYYLPNTSFYGKGKLGVAKTDVETKVQYIVNGKSTNIPPNESKGKVELAGGVGVGFAATPNVGIEAEYAKAGGDMDLVTVGAHLKF